jgi:ankyrin repeat protein
MAEHGLKEGQVVFVQDNINEEEESDDESTWSPLQLASQAGNLTLVSDLLSEGANPNEHPKGWYGKSALQGQQVSFSFPTTLSHDPGSMFRNSYAFSLPEYVSDLFMKLLPQQAISKS